MEANYQEILSCLLGCYPVDVTLLEYCCYDFDEVVDECQKKYDSVTIDNLMKTIFDFGKKDIYDVIQDRLQEFDDIVEEYGSLTPDQKMERYQLEKLDPYNDIEARHNGIDTNVWIKNHAYIYNHYLSKALHVFNIMTGFDISDPDMEIEPK